MKNKKWILLISCLLTRQLVLNAQDKSNIKFGKIANSDYELSMQKFDSGANAIIIADIGSTAFEGNIKGFMTMVFTRSMRVKIMNKNGFDIGEFRIPLYKDGAAHLEKLSNIKASTFNQENGSLVETKMDEKSIIIDHFDKHRDIIKFTMPALREGSVFDITYTIKSDFFENLQAWEFQSEFPCIWSEYQVTIPPAFHYIVRSQGDAQFDIKTTKNVFEKFSIRRNNGTDADDVYSLSGNSIQRRWVKKNVVPLKEESYTTTVQNYTSKLSFQLQYFQWNEDNERHDYSTTWYKACEELLGDERFGLALTHDNHWMDAELKIITADCKSDEEIIKRIYSYVRDNFSCNGSWGIRVNDQLKDVYKKKGGNVADINLMLTAMLRHENIAADPVIVSTRKNGIPSQIYPVIDEFNYVICVAHAGNKMYSLDASQVYNGFGHLAPYCYNGGARIVNAEKPYLLDLSPDSIQEAKLTSVFIINDEKGIPSGSYQTIFGNQGSYELRDEIKKSSQKEYFKDIQTQLGTDINIQNPGIDSMLNYDYPVKIHFDFDLKNLASGDLIYFNPIIGEVYKTNPFKSVERYYPVEMPYKLEETYVLNMDIPKGYQVDELPKSARVAYNGNEGIFEYLIQKNTDNIQMRVHLKLNKAFFPTEEYTTLRDFFGYVVKKENEQIVFKKIP